MLSPKWVIIGISPKLGNRNHACDERLFCRLPGWCRLEKIAGQDAGGGRIRKKQKFLAGR